MRNVRVAGTEQAHVVTVGTGNKPSAHGRMWTKPFPRGGNAKRRSAAQPRNGRLVPAVGFAMQALRRVPLAEPKSPCAGILSLVVKLRASSDLLIGQWAHSPTIVALVDAYVQQAQGIRDSIDELAIGRTLAAAKGVWLDWIGDRIGLPRPHAGSPADDPRFGFDNAGFGFDTVPFRGEPINDATFPLPDAAYRRLLAARLVAVRSDATLRSIERAIRLVDPGATVQDQRDMSIRVVTEQRGLVELADASGCLPCPAGVRIDYVGHPRPVPVLYMVDRREAALFSVDPATAEVTRIGSATAFGVGEMGPNGLASHEGVLYMVGATNDALYSLDTDTGMATRIGTATRFGVNEAGPQGLASRPFPAGLFMVGVGGIYQVDPATGVATAGSTVYGQETADWIRRTRPTGMAYSTASVLYFTGLGTGFSDNGHLYNEASESQVGPAGFGVGERAPTGLAFHNGVLYMIGDTHNALYTLDTDTGMATRIGTAGFSPDPRGIASHVPIR